MIIFQLLTSTPSLSKTSIILCQHVSFIGLILSWRICGFPVSFCKYPFPLCPYTSGLSVIIGKDTKHEP